MIDQIPQATRLAVRNEVFQALREYATSEQYSVIEMMQLFVNVKRQLQNKKVIPPSRSGTSSAPNFDVPNNIAQLIRQTVWELCLQNVLTPAPGKRDNVWFYFDPDYYVLTPYGIQVLTASADQIHVHDPEGYLDLFWSMSPQPDEVMMRYLAECIQVFQHHHLLATVVLLGAASERLLEVLAIHVRDALGPEGEQWFKTYAKKQKITDKFDAIDGKLRQKFGDKLDNRDLEIIRLSFEAIRRVRNDVVHEHDYHPSWNEIAGLLHNFVLHFKCVHRILVILLANPI